MSASAAACGKKKETPIATEPSAASVADPATPPPPPLPPKTPMKTGTIRGRVTFKGKLAPAKEIEHPRDGFCEKAKPKEAKVTRIGKSDGLLDVVVRLAPGTAKGDLARAPKATLAQDGCMYSPRVLGVMSGGDLELVNKDRTMHNIHGFAGDDTAFNAGQAMGSPPIFKKVQTEPGIVRVKCDVHPWMVAWLVVSDHPFFASTTEDGSFTFEAPVGAQTVEAVHPLHGTKSQKVEVKEGAITTVDFAFTDADKGPGP
jgi:plastocyanin